MTKHVWKDSGLSLWRNVHDQACMERFRSEFVEKVIFCLSDNDVACWNIE